MDNAGNPVWPEMFPPEKIKDLERIVGPRHFSAQMMLEYVAEDKAYLDPGALKFYTDDFDYHNSRIGDKLITGVAVYWDPSSGHRVSDGSVCALIYRDDKNKTAFIHDIMYMTVSDEDLQPLTTQCEQVLRFMQKHRVNRIGIETNGIGNALPEILRKISNDYQIYINITQISNHIKKEIRILNAIEPMLTTGRLFAKDTIQQTMLLAEMLAWSPVGSKEHDDGLDAVAGALAMMPIPTRALINPVGPIKANTDFKV